MDHASFSRPTVFFRLKRWLPLIVFALLAGFLYTGLSLDPREVPSPFIGKPAPAFTLPVTGHPEKRFSTADASGKVWLLNIWAPWCVGCKQEHRFLMQLADRGVLIYGLNWKDELKEAEQLLATDGSPFVLSVDDPDGRVVINYGVTGTPETFVIDRQGIIRLKHSGPINPVNWEKKFAPLLEKLNS